MIYHVLPGDAQVNEFQQSRVKGEMLVCREALIEGDVSGESLDEFLVNRAAFMNAVNDEDLALYNANVASQFRTIAKLTDGDEVNLWFEYELFCYVNMWFCIDLISRTGAVAFRVAPVYLTETDRWDGFGGATPQDMQKCFDTRIKLTREDIALGAALWQAFRTNDNEALSQLSEHVSPAFPYLKEVCKAAIERHETPSALVRELRSEGMTELREIFPEFRRRAGVYGFGDTQVKRLMENSL
jgi:hypothetical protein